MYATMTWNIGLTLIRGCFRKIIHQNKKRTGIFNWSVCGLFGGITLLTGMNVNEKELIFITHQWLNIRFPAELLLVGLVVFISWRKKHA
jgi:hypothetical protein